MVGILVLLLGDAGFWSRCAHAILRRHHNWQSMEIQWPERRNGSGVALSYGQSGKGGGTATSKRAMVGNHLLALYEIYTYRFSEPRSVTCGDTQCRTRYIRDERLEAKQRK